MLAKVGHFLLTGLNETKYFTSGTPASPALGRNRGRQAGTRTHYLLNAFLMRPGVMGSWRRHTPVREKKALSILT